MSKKQDANKQDAYKFLDILAEKLNVDSDAALSRALGVAPPAISRLRNGKLPIGATILLRAHELTGLHVREIRKWAEAA